MDIAGIGYGYRYYRNRVYAHDVEALDFPQVSIAQLILDSSIAAILHIAVNWSATLKKKGLRE